MESLKATNAVTPVMRGVTLDYGNLLKAKPLTKQSALA
jgi:hypothetical protein